MATYEGIDVSVHNDNIDFNKVKASGKSFVMIRAGYGRYLKQKDACFEQNYSRAKAAGLHIGAYWYSYAKSASEAQEEARVFLQIIAGKSFDFPLAFDIEDQTQVGLSTATKSAIVEAFCTAVERAGYYCMLYSYENFLSSQINSSTRKKYDVWCANISNTPSIDYGMHQYSFRGRVNGISGEVDLDRTTRDYPTIIKNAGLNGFKKPSKEPKVLDTTGFKYDDSNNGTLALKKLLKIAKAKGVITQSVDDNPGFGDGTEKAVNQFLKKLGYKENGIAGKNFINKLYDAIK